MAELDKQSVQSLSFEQKIKALPGKAQWRRDYLLRLLTMANEYIKCDRQAAAKTLLNQIEKQLYQAEVKKQSAQHLTQPPLPDFWEQSTIYIDAQKFSKSLLERARVMLPENEYQRMHVEFDSLLQKKDWQSLRKLREKVISRLQSSLRAKNLRLDFGQHRQQLTKELQVIGHYNDFNNVTQLAALIAENDPLWVEDFFSHYRGLQLLKNAFENQEPQPKKSSRV